MKTTEVIRPHHIQCRVYYEDTDAGGVVYHANYFRFAERGRTEFLREIGFEHHQVKSSHNVILMVCHAEIDWRAPGKLDDLLDIATETVECGNSSWKMRQVISRGERVLAEIKITVVAVGGSGKAVRIPPQLRQILGSHKASESV